MKSIRALLLAAALLTFGKAASAQTEYNVLSFAQNEMYYRYLVHRMYVQYGPRDSVFHTPVTLEKARAYSARAKQGYLDILGAMPEKTPLNAKVTATYDMGSFMMENILYESSPDRHVTATLYRPKKAGKYPAVVVLCGHGPMGKNSVGEQNSGALYTANGMIMMCIDPVSQGERMQLIDAHGNPQARGGTTEHTLLNTNSILLGQGTVKDELWDNTRGIDYLVSRPEVDENRIGCFGFSGGGTQSCYLLSYDDRVKAAGVGGFFTQRRRAIETGGAADGCQHIPGEGAALLEEADFIAAVAPKPVAIIGGNYDIVDRIGAEVSYRELQNLYNAYGKREQITMYFGDDGHVYPTDKREVMMNWFLKYLVGGNRTLVAGHAFTPVDVAKMNVTTTGNLSQFYASEMFIPKRNEALWTKAAPTRTAFAGKPVAEQQRIVRNTARIAPLAPIRPESVRSTLSGGNYKIEKLIIHAEDETPIPCLVFVPNQIKADAPVVIFTHDEGKAKFAAGTYELDLMASGGSIVIAADLRGLGETTDKLAPDGRPLSRNDLKYYNSEYTNAMVALHLGESVVAQRAKDLLMLIEYASAELRFKGHPITIEAYGKCVAPALHAAILDTRVGTMKLKTTVPSWKVILDNPTMWETISYIVPGAALQYDLPDLVTALKNRKVDVTVDR
ncbi:MAG: acetylxylan esterase [Rikenellaceae bacterium]|jgi:cephalosporin-C deacetylase-like acetyl esterase|nr:acetylxylan esterase [Rikenellaceae bacterium]